MKYIKKIILSILCIFLGGICIFISQKKSKNTNIAINKLDPHVKKEYLNKLHEQEVALWNSLSMQTGLKKQDCSVTQSKQNRRTVDSLISKKTKKIVDEVLSDFNVNPETISIMYKTDGYPSPAFSSADTLYINEHALAAYPEHAQKFVIGHEVQHILHNDTVIVENLMNKTNLDYQGFSKRFGSFLRFIELRADITTMLHDKKLYTEGGIYFNKHLFERYGDQHAPTHPTYSKRLQTAQNIFNNQPLSNALVA